MVWGLGGGGVEQGQGSCPALRRTELRDGKERSMLACSSGTSVSAG